MDVLKVNQLTLSGGGASVSGEGRGAELFVKILTSPSTRPCHTP